jgi:50S ribosomal protein uL3
MMRIFTDDGDSIPVTVVDVSNNRVAQIKTPETDGYSAVQVAFGQRRASRVTKAVAGHHAKAGVEAGTLLKEFRVDAAKAAELKAGEVVAASLFEVGQKIDVQGVSSVKAMPVPSSVTTSLRVVRPTVTRVRTTFQVPSVWRKIQVAFSLVSA